MGTRAEGWVGMGCYCKGDVAVFVGHSIIIQCPFKYRQFHEVIMWSLGSDVQIPPPSPPPHTHTLALARGGGGGGGGRREEYLDTQKG